MKQFALFVCFVAYQLQSTEADVEKVFASFAKTKVLESCFGRENTRSYITKLMKAVEECSGMQYSGKDSQSPTTTTTLPPFSRKDSESFGQAPFFSWNDLFNPDKSISFGSRRVIPVPVAVSTSDFEKLMYFRRSKRQIEDILFNENAVRNLKNNVVHTISNVTCILQNMDYVNDRYQLEFDYMVDEIKSLRLDSELEEDLIHGFNSCKDMTTCLPVDRMHTALPPNLKRVMQFMKCTEQQKLISCMKSDLRKQKNQFELRGLDGILDNLDEDDKMLAIVWGNTMINSRHDQVYDIVFKK